MRMFAKNNGLRGNCGFAEFMVHYAVEDLLLTIPSLFVIDGFPVMKSYVVHVFAVEAQRAIIMFLFSFLRTVVFLKSFKMPVPCTFFLYFTFFYKDVAATQLL